MKVHMYEDVPNFGDVLNKYIWPRYFPEALARDDDILMYGIGTLLGGEVAHQGRVIVCGSGAGYGNKVDDAIKNRLTFHFVRGPLSEKVLELPPGTAITDPAILTPECFPPGPKHGRVVFVPHWETSRNPLWRRACRLAGIDYIDPLGDITEIMAALSGARLVIAEAMHAAIIADSYRVPFVPVSTSARINRFKWQDWGQSLDLSPELHTLPALGVSDKFRNMTGGGRALKLDSAADAPKAGGSPLKALLRTGYHRLVPNALRRRKDHLLLWHVGPAIDTAFGWLIAGGYRDRALHNAAQQLGILSRNPGMLSDETLSATRRQQVRERLAQVREHLRAA